MLRQPLFQQVDLSAQILQNLKLGKYDDSISKGCVLESDLEYPEELLHLQNYNPFAPEKLEMLKKCCLIKNLKLLWIIILEFATLFKTRIQNKTVHRVL